MEAVLMSAGDRTVPLPALLSREILPRILRLLESGERRALAYLDRAPCAVVPFSRLFPGLDPEEVLLNVNTPADLERALALLSRTSER
jgi:molybdopterin-guanine dinucleotide biosynthesis protein A